MVGTHWTRLEIRWFNPNSYCTSQLFIFLLSLYSVQRDRATPFKVQEMSFRCPVVLFRLICLGADTWPLQHPPCSRTPQTLPRLTEGKFGLTLKWVAWLKYRVRGSCLLSLSSYCTPPSLTLHACLQVLHIYNNWHFPFDNLCLDTLPLFLWQPVMGVLANPCHLAATCRHG